jgi:S-adenosylmethionine/arginine decarboxylase-like enzyme
MKNLSKEFYNNSKVWGLLTSVDLYSCNSKTIRDAEAIKKYVIELCLLIEMKRFGDTKVVHFGEDEKVAGYSMVQLIETSLISGHFTNSTNNAYIDIFSCKYYNPLAVEEFTKKFFEAKETKMHYILRE